MLNDKRLLTIVSLTPKCEIAADIGADHGKLGCELLESQICKRLWFSDISADSLAKARLLVSKKGLDDRAEFFVGDGAEIFPHEPNAAIIAGMGGRTIAGILERGIDKLKNAALILGAHSEIYELRLKLYELGFCITDEAAVQESGKFYVLIQAISGYKNASDTEMRVGPVLIYKRDDDTKAYFNHRYLRARHALEKAQNSPDHVKQALKEETELWQKLL